MYLQYVLVKLSALIDESNFSSTVWQERLIFQSGTPWSSVREIMLFQLGIPWYFSWGYRTLISLGDALIFRFRIPWYFSKGHLYLYFVWRYLDISVRDTLIFQLENPWYFNQGLFDIAVGYLPTPWYFNWRTYDISSGTPWYYSWGHLDIPGLIFQKEGNFVPVFQLPTLIISAGG